MRLEDAQALAERLIKKHLPEGWTFEWNRRRRGFGVCWHGSKRITLSKINTPSETEEATEQTILHEIAHALVGLEHGHDKVWKAMARSIGVKNPTATRARSCEPEDAPEPAWVLICGDKIELEYFRKPARKTFERLHRQQLIGQPETLGKLQIVSYADYKRGVRTMTGVNRKFGKPEPTWVMVYAGEIVKRYYRKPNKKVFNDLPTLYLPRRGRHTMGRLELMPYKDYQRNKIQKAMFE